MMNDTDNNDNNNHHGSSVENRNIEDDVQVIPHTSTDIPNPHPRQPPTLDTNRNDMSAGRHPNDLPSYKDQTRTVVGYASNDENENTKAVDGSNQTTNVPIAEAIAYPESGIFVVSATHDVGAVGTITPTTADITTTINHNAATQRPPPPLPIPLIKHESRNESEVSGCDTKSWWTCTRIATLGMILVLVAAAVMTSVILCRDGNCRRTTPSSSMDTSKKNATTTTTTTTIYFMEDDLVTLQNAVDEYYAALSTIGPIDETNDEWMNVPVLRQYGYPISTWDVSRVTNFTSLFDGKRNEQLIDTFNEDLGDWNVSSSIDMFRMFGKLNIYEGYGLEHWDVSNVINMRSMFHEAYQFRGNVSMWDIQKVKTLTRLFSDCYIFNIDISSWKTNNAESMAWMVSICYYSDVCCGAHLLDDRTNNHATTWGF